MKPVINETTIEFDGKIIPMSDFKSHVNSSGGRRWEVETVVKGEVLTRSGLMSWEEYFDSWRCSVELASFVLTLKNVRSRHPHNASTNNIP